MGLALASQVLKDLVCKSNENAGLEFLKTLTKLVNVIANKKDPENNRPFFFGAKLMALLKEDGAHFDRQHLGESCCKVRWIQTLRWTKEILWKNTKWMWQSQRTIFSEEFLKSRLLKRMFCSSWNFKMHLTPRIARLCKNLCML